MDRRDRDPKRLKAEAYRFAAGEKDDDGNLPPIPHELALLSYIDRFGVQAVLGRPVLSAGEIRRMTFAENVKSAYLSRKGSTNWGAWAQDHPRQDRLLTEIEVMLNAND